MEIWNKIASQNSFHQHCNVAYYFFFVGGQGAEFY